LNPNNNRHAISNKKAIGIMQITQIALDEWNKFHPEEQYVFEELFNKEINEKIGRWLLDKQIPMYLKKYKIPQKTSYKLIIYNAGIGNFLRYYKTKDINKIPEETRDYLVKYWIEY
jgi:hypothetical protein